MAGLSFEEFAGGTAAAPGPATGDGYTGPRIPNTIAPALSPAEKLQANLTNIDSELARRDLSPRARQVLLEERESLQTAPATTAAAPVKTSMSFSEFAGGITAAPGRSNDPFAETKLQAAVGVGLQTLKEAGGNAAVVADMLLSFLGPFQFAVGHQLGTATIAAGQHALTGGEHGAPGSATPGVRRGRAAGDPAGFYGTPEGAATGLLRRQRPEVTEVKPDQFGQYTAFSAGREAGQRFAFHPVKSLLDMIGGGELYEGSATARTMNKFGQALEDFGLWMEQASGGRFPRDAGPMWAESLMMAMPGMKGKAKPAIDPGIQKVLREQAGKLKREAEAEGILRADEAAATATTPAENLARSPVRQQIDELLNSRAAPAAAATPEQVISMAAGKPRIKLKLEEAGLPLTAELEAALDKPRFQRTAEEQGALQRWHDSWLRLPEQARTAILTGGAASLGMLLAPEGEEGLGALGGIAVAGAVKPLGGMWHPEVMNRLAAPLKDSLVPDGLEAGRALAHRHPDQFAPDGRALNLTRAQELADAYVKPIEDWVDSRIKNWLNRYAGTSRDPLKDIEIPFGEGTKRWEEVMDDLITAAPAKNYRAYRAEMGKNYNNMMPEMLERVPDNELVYGIEGKPATVAANSRALLSHLSHVGDYLRQNVPAEKLGQYDFVRAMRETDAADKAAMRELQKNLEARKASAKKITDELPPEATYKEYPEQGLKWIEISNKLEPETVALNVSVDTALCAHCVGGVAHGKYGYKDWVPARDLVTRKKVHPSLPDTNDYIDAINAGESRIYSLRDAKGESHVTVEAIPTQAEFKPGEWEAVKKEMARTGEDEVPVIHRLFPEYRDLWDIPQIKGKGNRAPAAQYQPYVQDFVQKAPDGSPAKWGEVRDLGNTGLFDLAGRDIAESVLSRVPEGIRFLTKEEALALVEADLRARAAEINQPFERVGAAALEQARTRPEVLQKYLERPLSAAEARMEAGVPAVPRNQRGPGGLGGAQGGAVDSRLLIGAGTIGLGGLVGSAWADDPIRGFVLGSLAGGALALPGAKGLRGAADVIRDYAGQVSTELLNASPSLHRRLITHAQQELENTHKTLGRLVPWLKESVNLPASERTALYDAIFMKDTAALAKINAGNEKLVASWREVRNVLNELGQQSRILGRFKDMMEDYFPQRVKDYEGLKKALEQPVLARLEAKLKVAEQEALRKRGFSLTDVERDAIINREIRDHYRPATFRPGYAKPRRIQEVTESIRPFYHTPQESLAITVAEIVKDIELTRLFGKELVQKQQNGRTYIDLDASIGNIIGAEEAAGRLKGANLDRVEKILRARFGPGEKSPAKWIQNLQNTGYAALLADLPSAVVQMADPAISIPAHGWKATLVATARKLTGNAKITAKDMSLMDHIAEDLAFGSTQLGKGKNITRAVVAGGAATGAVAGAILADDPTGALPGAAAGAFLSYSRLVGTSAALNKVLRQGVFTPIDRFGKDIQLGAAHSKLSRWAEKDLPRLKEFYGEWFGADFPQFAADLRAGNMTPAVRSALFHELSRTQPISKLEAPMQYLESPNARIAWQLKRFMLKQGDFVYREATDAIKNGHKARGLAKLTEYALVLGLSGATTAMIKDWLNGRPVHFEGTDVAENVLKTFGLSNFVMDKMKEKGAGPIEAIGGAMLPPYIIMDRIIRADPRAVQYIPIIGELYYNWELGGQEKAELRVAKEMKKQGKDFELSPKAELYLERQREKRREKREREREARP